MSRWVGPLDDPDRYELVEARSRGGEGQLWLGILHLDGVPVEVAVKIVNPQSIPDMAAWRVRWQRQADLLRSVDHRGLVKVREVFDGPLPHVPGHADASSRTLYLIMEWASGENLEEWATARPARTFEESVVVLRGVAEAVDYLHSGPVGGRPMLHRDIKPANIIVTAGHSKLVDFGFARLEGNAHVTFAGTPSYMAPEVLAGHDHDAASDRFGLGATAFFAVTNTLPTMNDYQGMKERIEAVRGARARSGAAERLLSMLHPDPRQRPLSAAAWIESLVSANTSGTVVRTRRPAPPLPLQSNEQIGIEDTDGIPNRNRPLVIGGAVAAVLVVLLAGIALARGGGDGSTPVAGGSTGSATTTTATSTTSTTSTLPRGTMPSVLGQPESVARSLLRDQGASEVDIIVVERQSSDPQGLVIEQSPLSGKAISAPIRLTVSTGPGVTTTSSTTTSSSTTTTTTTTTRTPTTVPTTAQTVPSTAYLADLNPVSGFSSGRASSLNGDPYSRSVLQNFCSGCSDATVEYSINRQYRTFRALVGMNDTNREAAAKATFELYAVDGSARLLWSSVNAAPKGVGLGGAISTGDVDVDGVLRLRLVVRSTSGGGAAAWADARVTP